MTKRMRIVLLSAVAAVGVGLVLGCIAVFGLGITQENFEARSETFEQDIVTIHAELDSGDVKLYRTQSDEIQVLYYDNENHYFTVEERNGVLAITRKSLPWYQDPAGWIQLGGREYDVEIGVPEDFAGTLEIQSTAGSVQAEDIVCQGAQISSTYGEITLERVTSNGALTVTATAGNITLREVASAGGAQVKNTAGNVYLTDMQCEAELEVGTTAGNVELNSISALRGIQATSSSGWVGGTGIVCEGNFSASAYSGGVAFTDVRAEDIRAETTSGDIQMWKLQGQSIRLQAAAGNIDGSVTDGRENYTITSYTASGNNDVAPGSSNGEKILELNATSGNLRFSFNDR